MPINLACGLWDSVCVDTDRGEEDKFKVVRQLSEDPDSAQMGCWEGFSFLRISVSSFSRSGRISSQTFQTDKRSTPK